MGCPLRFYGINPILWLPGQKKDVFRNSNGNQL